jgi:hypothetical protein
MLIFHVLIQYSIFLQRINVTPVSPVSDSYHTPHVIVPATRNSIHMLVLATFQL